MLAWIQTGKPPFLLSSLIPNDYMHTPCLFAPLGQTEYWLWEISFHFHIINKKEYPIVITSFKEKYHCPRKQCSMRCLSESMLDFFFKFLVYQQ